ncbi:MAG: Ig-like protein [Planctomycetota bacterium]|nr:Ig-like protein [Planctomycetota bacterium]
MSRISVFALLLGVAFSARADDLSILPSSAVLDGPKVSQRFLVETASGGFFTGDQTANARFSIDDPRIATVSVDGTVSPVGDGATVLRAKFGDRIATSTITVKNFASNEPWSFKNHVLPVLTRAGCNMGSCHGAAAGKNGFRLTLRGYGPEVDYDVLSRQALGRRINKTAPEESLMLLKPSGAIEHGGGVRFSEDSLEYRVLAEWIASAMPRPREDEPGVVKVTAVPPAVRFRPGQTQQVTVQATYSDGRTADVTRWAKFGSTDETVAKVDESGQVKVEGRGEAAITVWFASLVDRSTISVPSELKDGSRIFAEAVRRNPIDEINLKKLASIGIPPSPECTDSAFLRRAYLDATGTLPPIEVVTAFLADVSPDKRVKLVDRLLQTSEYIDYWAYKWSDLLLVSSKKLPPNAMWSFYRSIRNAVETNVPWDEFARRVITARGSTLSNGAANYFVLHRDPIDLTESSSMAFLGMSLTCARCHNHPMEKWTQDQYYGMANLFSRVTLKDGERGEVIVSPAPDGDIVHPRKGIVMAPQALDAKPAPIESRGDRRELFASWLASPENPYFDRAIVNRVWRNFFGRGLIEPEDDLRATNPPSDEALMNWLVGDFRAHNRDVKSLVRTIMTSATYARSSDPVPGNEADTKFLSHYVVKRLPAEVLLDALSRATDVPTPFGGYPSGWRSIQLPDAQVANAFLSSFGRPERVSTCSCERSAEPSVAQALNLANGETLNQKLRDEKGAIARLVASTASDAVVVETLYKSALSRPPDEAERNRLTGVLAEATAGLKDAKETAAARRQAIEDLYWAILTGKEFLFNH